MNDEAKANALPAQLAAEIATLTFESHSAAVEKINHNGGLRAKYMNQLAPLKLSEPLRMSIGRSISETCDRVIQLLAPIQDANTGWTSHPQNLLTEQERTNK